MMFLVNNAMVDLNIGTAGLVALLGYCVVFFGLIALMVVVYVMGKIMVASRSKAAAKTAAAAPAAPKRAKRRKSLSPLTRQKSRDMIQFIKVLARRAFRPRLKAGKVTSSARPPESAGR